MSIKEQVKALRRIPLFSKLDDSRLNVLAFAADKMTFATGEILFEEGKRGAAGFLILDGTVDLRREELGRLAGGMSVSKDSLIGELSMLADVPYAATAVATSNVAALRIGKQLFYKVAEEFPEVAEHALKIIDGRIDTALAELRIVQKSLK